MDVSRRWVRNSVGLIASAIVSAAVFALPALGLFDAPRTPSYLPREDVGESVEALPERVATLRLPQVAASTGPVAPMEPAEALPVEAAPVEAAPVAEAAPSELAPEAPVTGPDAAEATAPPGTHRAAAEARSRRLTRPLDLVASGSRGTGASGTGGAKGSKSKCPKGIPEIRSAGEHSWEVDRSLVEYYTSSMSRVMDLGWSGPFEEGDEKGWKISSFGCSSPLYLAGLRRGDVIQTVNGRNTRNILQVFTTWKKLRKLDEFEVVILRKGEKLTLRYRLV